MEEVNNKEISEIENPVVTIGELNYNLPINPNALNTSYSFKNWNMKMEKEISKLKKESKTTGEFVSNVLLKTLNTINGQNIDGMDKDTNIILVNQLPLGNMLTAWIQLRIDALGNEFIMPVTCPSCRKTMDKVNFDLSQTNINTITSNEKTKFKYKLKRNFEIGEIAVEHINLQLTKWDVMEKMDDVTANDEGLLREALFLGSISGINEGISGIDIGRIVDNLSKIDIENLTVILSDFNAGPNLILTGKCQFCRNDYNQPLDWTYNYFFGSSSLPQN